MRFILEGTQRAIPGPVAGARPRYATSGPVVGAASPLALHNDLQLSETEQISRNANAPPDQIFTAQRLPAVDTPRNAGGTSKEGRRAFKYPKTTHTSRFKPVFSAEWTNFFEKSFVLRSIGLRFVWDASGRLPILWPRGDMPWQRGRGWL